MFVFEAIFLDRIFFNILNKNIRKLSLSDDNYLLFLFLYRKISLIVLGNKIMRGEGKEENKKLHLRGAIKVFIRRGLKKTKWERAGQFKNPQKVIKFLIIFSSFLLNENIFRLSFIFALLRIVVLFLALSKP